MNSVRAPESVPATNSFLQSLMAAAFLHRCPLQTGSTAGPVEDRDRKRSTAAMSTASDANAAASGSCRFTWHGHFEQLGTAQLKPDTLGVREPQRDLSC